jgi:hypothetical protein
LADWLFGAGIFIMLCIISVQLRGLRRQAAVMREDSKPLGVAADLSFAAWLEELESKGSEILARLEDERLAVEQMLERQVEQPSGNLASARPVPGKVNMAGVSVSPEEWLLAKMRHEDADPMHERFWVATQPVHGEQSAPYVKTQSHRQKWADTQRKVSELLQQGASVAAIARTLHLSQGEVQLIISKLAAIRRAG